MLLQEEQYIIHWLTEYGALTKTQVVRMLKDKPPQTAEKIIRGLKRDVLLYTHPTRTMEYVYVPMLVSASKISDEISQAAITRGIDHMERRTTLEKVGFRTVDIALMILYAGMVALLIWAAAKGVW